MKKVILFSLTLAITFLAATTGAVAQKLSVDSKETKVKWYAEKVTGKHDGSLNVQSGDITLEKGKISKANIVLDMTSIRVDDLDGESKGKLEGHLKSEDFFNVAAHANSSFTLTEFKEMKSKTGNYEVTGNLTIKGISHPITFPAQVDITDGKLTATADVIFDRAKYDIRYNSGSFFDGLGDYMIYDDVKISFELLAL